MGSTASGRPESMVFFKPDKTAAVAGKDKAKHLLDELKGSLFPMHTKLFIERLGVSSDLIKAIINDDVAKVNTMSATMTGDDFKEIMLIAAFMGANQVFNAMRTAHHF
ncbi:hypothetical protein [Legionella sp. km772]|uniref:hypothetical protein n=1 Tax=Legionella sp. km772 TaxID=2498111 RepID=UPI000F8D9331|nr:hypothetical protein [Legionella sp. km772]RUR12314.1 hypothetical protein ELY15_05585 [Legionella sp. km772]